MMESVEENRLGFSLVAGDVGLAGQPSDGRASNPQGPQTVS